MSRHVERIADHLKAVPLFHRLPPEHLERVAALAECRPLASNSILWTRGDFKDALVVLLQGRLKVILSSEDGREVTLNVLGPPSYLGEMSVLSQVPHSATVVAVEACELLWVPGTAFRALLDQEPRILWQLLEAQNDRIRALSEEVASYAFMSTVRRVARKLLYLARGTGSVAISHQELASLVGSTRESVTRALAELERQKLVRTDKMRISLNDESGLSALVEDV